tara:strand:+ start:694 stop:1164 length:471 start_codon:yes stop_codon:yes gene_type:complete
MRKFLLILIGVCLNTFQAHASSRSFVQVCEALFRDHGDLLDQDLADQLKTAPYDHRTTTDAVRFKLDSLVAFNRLGLWLERRGATVFGFYAYEGESHSDFTIDAHVSDPRLYLDAIEFGGIKKIEDASTLGGGQSLLPRFSPRYSVLANRFTRIQV